MIKFLLSPPFSGALSTDMKYKLATYVGVCFPSADELIAIYHEYRTTYSLDLRDAFYHSHSTKRVPYAAGPTKYFLGPAHKMNTFRLVIGKT